DGSALANFEFTDGRGAAADAPAPLDLALSVEGRNAAAAVDDALRIGECVAAARTLAATPPNVAHPAYLVRYCRTLARKHGLRCTVIDRAQARRLHCGGLLAVGAGGSTPPAMIVLEWPGK